MEKQLETGIFDFPSGVLPTGNGGLCIGKYVYDKEFADANMGKFKDFAHYLEQYTKHEKDLIIEHADVIIKSDNIALAIHLLVSEHQESNIHKEFSLREEIMKIGIKSACKDFINSKGVKHDQEKRRTDLIPVLPLLGLADVLTFGAKKYADRNWEKGIKFSRVYGAALRHLTAWWNGEDSDPETGLSHLDHAMCCVTFLSEYVKREKFKEFDDRPYHA